MPFCLTDEEKKTTSRPRYTHIYAFCLYCQCFVCPSVCQCFVLYNVRAYVGVRLNVYKYKIMLTSVNSFGYMKMMLYLCIVKVNSILLI